MPRTRVEASRVERASGPKRSLKSGRADVRPQKTTPKQRWIRGRIAPWEAAGSYPPIPSIDPTQNAIQLPRGRRPSRTQTICTHISDRSVCVRRRARAPYFALLACLLACFGPITSRSRARIVVGRSSSCVNQSIKPLPHLTTPSPPVAPAFLIQHMHTYATPPSQIPPPSLYYTHSRHAALPVLSAPLPPSPARAPLRSRRRCRCRRAARCPACASRGRTPPVCVCVRVVVCGNRNQSANDSAQDHRSIVNVSQSVNQPVPKASTHLVDDAVPVAVRLVCTCKAPSSDQKSIDQFINPTLYPNHRPNSTHRSSPGAPRPSGSRPARSPRASGSGR